MATTCPAQQRRQRHRTWRAATWATHLAAAVVVAAMATELTRFAGIAATIVAVVPALGLVWHERRNPTGTAPSRFRNRSIGVALVQGVAVGLVVDNTIGWLVAPVAAAALSLPAIAAFRALRYPLSADLGDTDVEIKVRIRPIGNQPAWTNPHAVTLTGTEIVVRAQQGLTHAYEEHIPLAAVLDIDVRPTVPADDPWFVLEDLRLPTPAGDVLVVRHTSGQRVLPVLHAADFGAVANARVRAVAAARVE
ncbi:hypothetical protein [Pseudonocardia sp. TRM90224]|uniref:hypothetical protein n=1 Tax=Pseudonocardia sp. TRM90224 TaxID=2812678 RepID=UPI001E40CE12|nr:hypothetical protein [Pseudonocardia sp. TRM90224]